MYVYVYVYIFFKYPWTNSNIWGTNSYFCRVNFENIKIIIYIYIGKFLNFGPPPIYIAPSLEEILCSRHFHNKS